MVFTIAQHVRDVYIAAAAVLSLRRRDSLPYALNHRQGGYSSRSDPVFINVILNKCGHRFFEHVPPWSLQRIQLFSFTPESGSFIFVTASIILLVSISLGVSNRTTVGLRPYMYRFKLCLSSNIL